MKQATYWYAQLSDGTKIQGGQQHIYPNQPNVSVVSPQDLQIFCIAHNTFTDQYYQPWDKWYISRVESKVVYPLEYIMSDNSILTINKDDKAGHLTLTQNYEESI